MSNRNYVIVDYSSDYTPNLFKVYLNGDGRELGAFETREEAFSLVLDLEEGLDDYSVNTAGKFPTDYAEYPDDLGNKIYLKEFADE